MTLTLVLEQVHLEAIMGPRARLHDASQLVVQVYIAGQVAEDIHVDLNPVFDFVDLKSTSLDRRH